MKKFLYTIMVFAAAAHANGQKILRMELFSPRAGIGLTLNDHRFSLYRQTEMYDVTTQYPIQTGSFSLKADTLLLQSDKGRTTRLIRKDTGIFDPVDVDSAQPGQLFLAWTLYYENGVHSENGGWTMDGHKDGVWQYFDSSTAKVVNKRLYKNGVLIKDHFEYTFTPLFGSRRLPRDSLGSPVRGPFE